MTTRREFFKSTGAGLALASLTDTTSLGAQALTNKLVSGSPVMEFKVTPPLFCPYYSSGRADQKGGNAYYYKRDAFVDNPFTTPASGMSGSPVVIDAHGKMVGFTSSQGYEDSTFSFDGKDTLKVQVPPGQELFVDEHGDGEKAWKDYNTLMMKRLNISPLTSSPTFWSDVEYCTWVEQKFLSTKKQEHFNLLNHDFIKKYLDELIALGYPKGKLTLDHGWGTFPDGTIDSGFGSWVPDPKKFPDFRKTMDLIVNKGFTPGLWIGFPKIHAQSMIAQQYPDLLGSWEANNAQRKPKDMRYLNPKADIYSYASEVIHRFYKMGVMKFKIDMSYNTKADMLPIHK
ncbi:melibiase [Dyadobacter jejuensis]|uniref:Melibiase n=1 Tax=Dyadobacter jejuensis TaxID=1082580 RepID=A0A316B5N9_9BACT|nr:alpha-galactosidase [Dyadobacter jejuensis]PWJ57957.1 melibiase [Dyadobacter jejuensis]